MHYLNTYWEEGTVHTQNTRFGLVRKGQERRGKNVLFFEGLGEAPFGSVTFADGERGLAAEG